MKHNCKVKAIGGIVEYCTRCEKEKRVQDIIDHWMKQSDNWAHLTPIDFIECRCGLQYGYACLDRNGLSLFIGRGKA